jgi:superfamily II DNA or RNA helicase
MSLESLRQWLTSQSSFSEKLRSLVRSGVLNEFPSIDSEKRAEHHDWPYLLTCASLLARSDAASEQRIALRIADTCLQLSTENEEKLAAGIVLDTMANKPSLQLAARRHILPDEIERELPLPLRADFIKRDTEDRVRTVDGVSHAVNRFQREFWEALNGDLWVSASAPTSAGKSFILRLWVAEVFRKKPNARVAFVVPTRALIQEFSISFGDDLSNGVLKNLTIHSLPLEGDFDPSTGHLFIFTQERLHILLGRQPSLSFDLLVIDEAQKVGDGYRGILLEQVIAECVRRSALTQLVYASPFVSNPGYLIRGAPQDTSTRPVDREVTTVTQNMLFVSQKRGNPEIWHVSVPSEAGEIIIGDVKLPFRATSEGKRLSTVAFALKSSTGGNLVYANGAMDAEKYAQHIAEGYKQQGTPSLEVNQRIQDLIKLVRKTIHSQYLLVETLKQGVAYHYGNMPLLIRTEIEGLFREGILRFLICTATLIEGVNLPCKVIFLRGPSKGRGNPMQAPDFWNLAGRAGRWGKEFHGTIVCIDPIKSGVWKIPPPVERVRQEIKSSTELTLENPNLLFTYIEDSYPIAIGRETPELDYTLTYFFHTFIRHGTISKAPSVKTLSTEQLTRLESVIRSEIESFPLPTDLFFKHPGILPHALVQMLEAFRALTEDEIVDLAPILPESEDAIDRYKEIFRFINTHLRANWAISEFGGEKRITQLAILAVRWMQGRPLSLLIRERIRVNEARGELGLREQKLSAVIIAVMSDVETYARFLIPKFLRAFLDVLAFHARERGMEAKLPQLPNLELWLELGVSGRTQLSLMELGLSRTAAIEVFEFMMNPDMDKESTLVWLRSTGESLSPNLPELVNQEIRRVLARYKQIE